MVNKVLSALLFAMVFQYVSAQAVSTNYYTEIVPHFNTLIFLEGSKKGIKNKEKTLLKAEYDDVWEAAKDCYTLIKSGKKNVFYIDKIVLPTDVEEIRFVANDTFIAINNKENSIYVLDVDNRYKLALKTKSELVVNNGFTLVLNDGSGKKRIYFKNGKSLPDRYSYVNIYNNVVMASINYKWGIIKDGNEVTPFMYDSIDTAGMRYKQRSDNGYLMRYKKVMYFIVQLHEKYGIIDTEGKIIFPVQYDEISLDESTAMYTLRLNGKTETFDGNK